MSPRGTDVLVLALATFICGLVSPEVMAHPLAPHLLVLRELGGGRVEVEWKSSIWRPTGTDVKPTLPRRCTEIDRAAVESGPGSLTQRWTVDCGARGLSGATIAVAGLRQSQTDAIVRTVFADGHVVRALLSADDEALTIPAREARWQLARGYVRLGVAHLLTGTDHLAFVWGLFLLVPSRRKLLSTITAFTAGHSVTLTLAALGVVSFPTAPVEIAIALTIFVLAVELARPEPRTWIRRRPWAMAFTFGLLHGLGFAGALAEIGLPSGEIPLALLSFNAGIELGQLVFVGLLLPLQMLLRTCRFVLPTAARQLPAYAIGSAAVFWCLERTARLL